MKIDYTKIRAIIEQINNIGKSLPEETDLNYPDDLPNNTEPERFENPNDILLTPEFYDIEP